MSSGRINGMGTRKGRPLTIATSSEWATISSSSINQESETIHLKCLPPRHQRSISTLSEASSSGTVRARLRDDTGPRPFDAGVDRPRTYSLGAADALFMAGGDHNESGSRVPSVNRHSLANPFESATSHDRRIRISQANPFESARPVSDLSSREENEYQVAHRSPVRAPSPALVSQNTRNVGYTNRRASRIPTLHVGVQSPPIRLVNLQSPPQPRRNRNIGSMYLQTSNPGLADSSPPLHGHFGARRASVNSISDDTDRGRSQYNDWVTWEQQRAAALRDARRRNKRNTAIAFVVAFVISMVSITVVGFM
jgi:hypothetical protein